MRFDPDDALSFRDNFVAGAADPRLILTARSPLHAAILGYNLGVSVQVIERSWRHGVALTPQQPLSQRSKRKGRREENCFATSS